MYLPFTTKIPDCPGKIIRKKVSNTTYILYQHGTRYLPKKQYAIPIRTCIGKETNDGLLIPNEHFHKFFPECDLTGDNPRIYRSGCLHVGTFFVIRRIVEDYCLPEILGEFMSSKDLGLFFDLMTYSLITEGNTAQYYPEYAYNHPLFTEGMKIYSDSKVSTFLNSLTADQSIGFLNSWNQNRNRSERIYISYDSTNKNSQAGDLTMVEFGNAKDDLKLPIFNYSLAHDLTRKEPLFYEEYPGSVVDVSQLQYMLEKAQGYGYRNVGFVLDRGYFSKDNIRFLDENNYSFIFMMKGMKKLVSNLIKSVKGSFECSRACEIREYKTYGMTVKTKLYAEDQKNRYIHIYHSTGREHYERENIEYKLERLMKYLRKNEGGIIVESEIIRHYFDLFYDKNKEKFLFAKEKAKVVEEELALGGYFSIVTSEDMTAREALTLYKSRDDSEKLFRGDKSYLGNRSMRVYSNESTAAKLFIEFVALIVRNKIYTRLKAAVLKNDKKANYMTVPAAIRELEKIEMIRPGDGIYRLDHAVTSTQKEILRAFGLDERFIKDQTTELSKLLQNL